MQTGYFFDLDGTLYDNRYHSVSKATLRALETLRQRGDKVFLATSRTLEELSHLPCGMRAFPFDGRIVDGGSRIQDADHTDLQIRAIEASVVGKLAAFCDAHHLIWRYSTPEGNYWGNEPSIYTHHAYNRLYLCAPVRKPYANDRALNILVFVSEEDLKKQLRQLLVSCSVVCYDHAMEIRTDTVDKSRAVLWCKERWHLDRVICFGDGENDIDMLKIADLGIAVGNAHPRLKKAADLVIDPIDRDGIAAYINKEES